MAQTSTWALLMMDLMSARTALRERTENRPASAPGCARDTPLSATIQASARRFHTNRLVQQAGITSHLTPLSRSNPIVANPYLHSLGPIPFTKGTYGEATGLGSSACSGFCTAGWYCPEPGSVGSCAHSSSDGYEAYVCPGSSTATPDSDKCAAGYYGGAGQTTSTCTGLCPAG